MSLEIRTILIASVAATNEKDIKIVVLPTLSQLGLKSLDWDVSECSYVST